MQHNDTREPRVLTLGMLGTGEHRANEKMIVDELIRTIVRDDPNQSFYLLDGPGGRPSKTEKKHPMLGTYDPMIEFDPDTGQFSEIKEPKRRSKEYQERLKTIPAEQLKKMQELKAIPTVQLKKTKIHKAGGVISGSGYREAIVETERIIDSILAKDTEIANGQRKLIINMAGFSRGAVTLLLITNTLAARYPDIDLEVNIFAIDPVPGPKRARANKATFVPSIVKHMIVTSMQDESTPGFAPQDTTKLAIQDPEHTKVEQRIYRGKHGHAKRFWSIPNPVKGENDPFNDIQLNTIDGAKLLWHDLHQFARHNGTKLGSAIPYVYRHETNRDKDGYMDYSRPNPTGENSAADRLKFYNQMVLNKGFYIKAAGRGTHRKFVDHKEDFFLHGRQFFQDREHMALFKQAYPAFFDYYFQKNISGDSPDNVIRDIKKMQGTENYLLKLLSQHQLPFFKGDNITVEHLGSPQGIRLEADFFYWNKELLQLKEDYPQFFNYFLQYKHDPVDERQLGSELQRIQGNPDLLEFLERVGLHDIGKLDMDNLPKPAGHPNIVQTLEKYNELIRLWNATQNICQAVLNGNDKSFSKKEARALLTTLRFHLDTGPSAAVKLQDMQYAIKRTVQENKHKPSLFIYKLNNIQVNPDNHLQLVNHTYAALNKFDLTKVNPERQKLIEDMLNTLRQLHEQGLGNNTRAISEILLIGSQASGYMLRKDFQQAETPLDKTLRQLMRDLPSYGARETPAAQKIVNELREIYFIRSENNANRPNPAAFVQAEAKTSPTPKRRFSGEFSRNSLRFSSLFSRTNTESKRQSPPRKDIKAEKEKEPEQEKEREQSKAPVKETEENKWVSGGIKRHV